jgi:NAD(P)-dependent dehydrogenase (short-subunit alcohol dehydrogenase family)
MSISEQTVKKLAGKIAIITGAGAGIGEVSALLFAREGARIVVVDRDEPRANAAVAHILADGGQAIAVSADVTRSDDVHRIIARTLQALGKPNILFNNAGVNQEGRRPLTHIPECCRLDWRFMVRNQRDSDMGAGHTGWRGSQRARLCLG